MEDNKLNKKYFTKSKMIILVSAIIATAILIIGILAVIFNRNSSETIAAGQLEDTNVYQTNTEVENLNNIEGNTETQTVKTEEELKKINEEEIKKAEEEAKKSGQKVNTKSKYFIKVNLQAQVINVYTYDKNGEYTVPVKAFVCSTGSGTPSSGTYTMAASGGSKRRVWALYGGVYGQYVTPIVGDILFHSVPYLKKNGNDVVHDSLKYWEYDKLGTKASMGCIRLTTADAKWIYDNVSLWTKVEFYHSSNPGPFGKPTAQKISNAPGNLKNWDPTDPNPNNPWRNYKPGQDDNKNDVKNEQKNETTNTQNNTQVNNTVNNENANNEVNNKIENETDNTQVNNTIENNTNENKVVENELKNNEIVNNAENTTQNINKNEQLEDNNIKQNTEKRL